MALGSIPGVEFAEGDSATVDLSGFFRDPDGDRLTYAGNTSNAAVAVASVAGSTILVLAISEGVAAVTATATDPGGLTARQEFQVRVTPPANRAPIAVGAIPRVELAERDSVIVDLVGFFQDPDGDSLTYADSTSNAAVVVTASAAGSTVLVIGVSEGVATVTVTAMDPGGLTAHQDFQVVVSAQSEVIITGVEPNVLVEGQDAIIRGSGFSTHSGDNRVSVGGRPALVTAASDTSLSVIVPQSDCLPPRREELRVTVLLRSAARLVGVTPLSREDLELSPYVYRYTRAGDGCIHLPGDASGGEYLIGVLSISESPSDLTPVMLTSNVGVGSVLPEADPVTGIAERTMPVAPMALRQTGRSRPLQVSHGDESPLPVSHGPRYDKRSHYETLATNRALMDELGRQPTSSPVRAMPGQVVSTGDTLLLFAAPTRTCSSGERVQTVVRFVGDHTVWLEDLSNSGGSLTDSNFEGLENFYTSRLRDMHHEYYGTLSDVDGNGRLLILMTQEVNRTGASGAVWSGDLRAEAFCASSNRAEIVYAQAPDPDGTAGQPITAAEVRASIERMLAHEITHLVQYNASIHGGAGDKATWELEGGAELAEQLVGFGLFRHESGQNLGYGEFIAGQEWYAGWMRDLLRFFGWDPSAMSSAAVDGAPEECGWLDGVEDGAIGPCVGGALDGVASLVLRYAMDRWGEEYPGGEQGLLRRLTQSPHSGFAALEDVSNWRIEQLLADFYIGLWMDGRRLPSGEILDSFGFTTWDLYGIIGNLLTLPFRPQIGVSSTASFSRSWNVRAGSTSYVHWTPSSSRRAPTSLKVSSPDGDPIPGHVSVWALRIR
ncbi:IPT/TIG domain-containing protein [Candidatus Palauibacter sp.]|uniref:IPT/TIG domain-containing protein n=1 Tax=Candidatus Palauibacter sp. TaxID=3101350 RepID=UPI003AF2691E